MKSTSKATSFDIAHFAGVSQSTVSRALRNSPLVNEETRRKVHKIAKELNYKVDKNASNLRSQQSNTLALLLFEDPTSDDSHINPFFLNLLGSITRACSHAGYDLLVSFQSSSKDWQADYEDSHRADGLILLGYGDFIDYQSKLEKLVNNDVKFVCWGATYPDKPELTVTCDNYAGGVLAAEYLLKRARNKCVFIGDASDHSPEFFERFKGFKETLTRGHIDFGEKQVVNAISTEESGYHATCSLLANNIQFDSVFAASDLIAIGAIRALQEAGLSVPKDVAVIGFDNISAASFINPPLTTIEQNTVEAGETLVSNLVALINKDKNLKSPILPPKLVVRNSA